MYIIDKLPKAELHVHIEGTVTPELARRMAAGHGIALPGDIFAPDGQSYRWKDFIDLVTRVYQAMAQCIRTQEDFETVVYDYLCRCADEGAIYVEMIACPGQCHLVGIPYKTMIDGIAAGIDRARKDRGIEARINVTFERHRPGAEAEKDAAMILSYPHPYIVGLDIAGGEREGDIAQFRPVFERIRKEFGRPPGIRMHAGEWIGPRNVWDALEYGVTRIGHGVRCIDDPALVKELARRGTVLEVCPSSNILAGIYRNFGEHPLRRLYDAGVKITLNSDDPGLFGCTVGGEYRVAHDHFGFTPAELEGITRTAIEAAYVDDALRTALLARLNGGAGKVRKAL